MVRLLALLALPLLAACDNPCQSLCVEMAAYAEECGCEVSSDDVATCRDDNASDTLTDERAQQCITASDADQLREWWTCDELFENFESCAS